MARPAAATDCSERLSEQLRRVLTVAAVMHGLRCRPATSREIHEAVRSQTTYEACSRTIRRDLHVLRSLGVVRCGYGIRMQERPKIGSYRYGEQALHWQWRPNANLFLNSQLTLAALIDAENREGKRPGRRGKRPNRPGQATP